MIQKLLDISFLRTKKSLVSNFIWLALLQGAEYLLPLLTLPYLVRILGVEKYGIIMFAQAFITYFGLVITWGFNISAAREISVNQKDSKKISEIFVAVFILKAMLLLISVAVLCLVVFCFDFDKFREYQAIYFYTFGTVLGNAFFPIWLFQGMEKMKFITILFASAKLIFTLLVFTFIKQSSDFYKVPIITSIGYLTSGITGLCLGIKYFNITFVMPSKKRIREIFNESTDIFWANLSASLSATINTVMLGFFASEATVGVYSSIEKLVVGMKVIFSPLYQALFPWLSKKSHEQISNIITRIVKYIAAAALFMTAGTIIFAKQMLHIIFRSETISNNYHLLQIMSLASLMSGISSLFMLYLSSVKAYSSRMKIVMTTGLFNVVSVFLFTYNLGITGTAVAVVITETLMLILSYYYFKKTSHNKSIVDAVEGVVKRPNFFIANAVTKISKRRKKTAE